MKLAHRWFFSKMYRVSQASMMAMSLSSYSGKLPKWGMTDNNGDILELLVSVRHTDENAGSVLYPTPSASDGTRGASTDPKYFGESETGALYRQSDKGVRYGMNLTQYVAMEAGQNWGTPTASSYKGCGKINSKSHKHLNERLYVEAQVIIDEHDKPRQLNPDWVDLLQGYPIGYTDLDIEDITVDLASHQFPAYRNQEQHEFEPPRVTERKDQRRDRVKALGNAVVPQCVLPIALEMFEELTNS